MFRHRCRVALEGDTMMNATHVRIRVSPGRDPASPSFSVATRAGRKCLLAGSCAVAALLWVAAPSARGQITVPTGYQVQTFNIGTELNGLAVGPGGAFGTDLFAAVNGGILRIIPATGSSSSFATGLATGNGRPSGLAFDTGRFGTGQLYVSQNNGSVAAVTSGGAVSVFTSGGNVFDSNDVVFAPAGSPFGANLFVSNGAFATGTIATVNSSGVNAPFAAAGQFPGTPIGLDFAPAGSAFGNNLFTSVIGGTVSQVIPGGTATTFASGLGLPADLAFGRAAFGDFLYVSDPSNQRLLRVAPDGTVTPFATGFGFSAAAFDADLTFSLAGDTLYVANNAQLVVITPVPGPGFVLFMSGSGVGLLALARQRPRIGLSRPTLQPGA